MDTLPLPPRPSLEQYKKRAKDLVTAVNSDDPAVVRAWAAGWLAALVKLTGITITPFVQSSLDRAIGAIEARVRKQTASHATGATFRLADAQFLVAHAHGFENWAEFAEHLERISRADADGDEFERAVDAIISGDLTTLELLVRRHPDLIRARSARVHRATLLHYVAANGVEDFRQKTPPNAVIIARFLLETGAEVDAVANTYGGGEAQTTMNLLVSSEHPANAGLQSALVELLLDFGAAVDGLGDDGSPIMTALAFGYPQAAGTLATRGARIDNVVAAAALGQADLVRRLVVDATTLAPDAAFVQTRWMRVPRDAQAHIDMALVWAAKFGRAPVVELLLDRGVDPGAKGKDDMTALHWAAANGLMDVIALLLRHGAPLEVKNAWGGTVLDSTVYFARHEPVDGVHYPDVIQTLIAAGAEVGAVRLPTGDARLDELLRLRGNRSG
jgi:ankyrin repeat protein